MRSIGNLSGGERRRLYLLRILMGSPNVLAARRTDQRSRHPDADRARRISRRFCRARSSSSATTAIFSTARSTTFSNSKAAARSANSPAITRLIWKSPQREEAENKTRERPRQSARHKIVRQPKTRKRRIHKNSLSKKNANSKRSKPRFPKPKNGSPKSKTNSSHFATDAYKFNELVHRTAKIKRAARNRHRKMAGII